MEPQHVYRQKQKSDFEETQFAYTYRQQEKINVQKEMPPVILNIVLQFIIAFSSYMNFMISNPRTAHSMLINTILINLFFFVALWFPQRGLRRRRKALYACLLFVLTLVLVVLSVIVTQADRSGFGSLGILAIIALLDLGLYWLLKLTPTITI